MSLIERMEAAEVGSREMDAEVASALFDAPWMVSLCKRPLTTSLDAALSLAERVLPGYWPGLQKNRGVDLLEMWTAHLESDEVRYTEADGATPALALCIAILKARETK